MQFGICHFMRGRVRIYVPTLRRRQSRMKQFCVDIGTRSRMGSHALLAGTWAIIWAQWLKGASVIARSRLR